MSEGITFKADRRRIRVVSLILVAYGAGFWWWYADDPVRWMLAPIVASAVCALGLLLLDLVLASRTILEVGDEGVRWRSPWAGGWRQVSYDDVDAVDWRVDTAGLRVGPDDTRWVPFGSLRKRDRERAKALLGERLDDSS